MPTKKQATSTDAAAIFDKLIATIPEIDRKGDVNPYTSLNGNMFTLLHQSRLAIRLPVGEREKFLKKHKTALFEAYAHGDEGVCCGSRFVIGEYKRTEEVPRPEL